jgi:hypothetical protein
VLPFASSRCWHEPTARDALTSARAAIGSAVIWGILGTVCPAATADLDLPVTASWSGVGLREWAGRLGETAGLPVLVDRRLDPDAAIRLDCRGEPLRDVLDRGAAIAGGEVATLRSSVRIVPTGLASVVSRAETARESRMASLPPRQRSVLEKQMPWQWPAGSRPRDLVADAAAKAGITLEGVAMVPHDHLPEASLPEMTLAEGLDLLLASFDLRIDWQPPRVAAGSPTPRAPSGRIIAIDANLPAAAATADAAAQATATPAAGKPPRRPAPDRSKPGTVKQTFSLQVAAPLDELLAAIAARLEVKLDIDRESLTRAGIAPREIVRATVKDASRDELLDAILDPLELEWKIDAKTLRVFAH